MRRLSLLLGLALSGVVVGGCASTPKRDLARPAAGEYRIGVEDVIEVAVYRADNLSRTLPVRPDGKVSLPLLGDVNASGKTAGELAEELQGRYGQYLTEPHVSVIVREVNAPRVYVMGEVGHPGVFPLRGEINVVQAVALAGGFGPFADRGGLVLLRRAGDREQREELDYDDLIESGQIPVLMPGDTLVVP
jgi:polysaccharide export outer membrane protein